MIASPAETGAGNVMPRSAGRALLEIITQCAAPSA